MSRYYSLSVFHRKDGEGFFLIHYNYKMKCRRVDDFEDLPLELRREVAKRCIVPTLQVISPTGTRVYNYRIG